jgi:hypothetical protein
MMGSYAKVRDGVVNRVIVADEDFVNRYIDNEVGKWIQTSYNTRGGIHYDPATGQPSPDQSKALRKNFAGIGYTYDSGRDAFYPPKPFPSWTLNETSCQWEAPVAMPSDGKMYSWDESTKQWTEVTNG